MIDNVLKDLLLNLEDELEGANKDIGRYEDGTLKHLRENFYDYATLKGYAWGMSRAIVLLKCKAEKAGIEVSE